MSDPRFISEIIDIVCEVEYFNFFDLPNLRCYVAEYIRDFTESNDEHYLGNNESHYHEYADLLIEEMRLCPSDYVFSIRIIKLKIIMDWLMNGRA